MSWEETQNRIGGLAERAEVELGRMFESPGRPVEPMRELMEEYFRLHGEVIRADEPGGPPPPTFLQFFEASPVYQELVGEFSSLGFRPDSWQKKWRAIWMDIQEELDYERATVRNTPLIARLPPPKAAENFVQTTLHSAEVAGRFSTEDWEGFIDSELASPRLVNALHAAPIIPEDLGRRSDFWDRSNAARSAYLFFGQPVVEVPTRSWWRMFLDWVKSLFGKGPPPGEETGEEERWAPSPLPYVPSTELRGWENCWSDLQEWQRHCDEDAAILDEARIPMGSVSLEFREDAEEIRSEISQVEIPPALPEQEWAEPGQVFRRRIGEEQENLDRLQEAFRQLQIDPDPHEEQENPPPEELGSNESEEGGSETDGMMS